MSKPDTMKKYLIILCAVMCAACTSHKPTFDTFVTESGEDVNFTFYGHATLCLSYEGNTIYIDPVESQLGRMSSCPKADAIMFTHHHSDHFDRRAIDALSGGDCTVYCDATTASMMPDVKCVAVRPEDVFEVCGIAVTAVAAYNTTEGHLDFHPRSREDVGYVFEIGGSRIYVAGDSEPTPEMLALKHIDVAFLPVNQPYTMTEQQASQVIHVLRPRIFYPYHYGQVEDVTDLELLRRLIADTPTQMRVEPME